MAENILKLKVDSTSYDAKIKRAKDGLLAMEAACRKVGGTFEVVEKEDLEFVKALGKMETTSRSLKGKIGELSAAFTDLSSMYNRLSDAEKQSPWGKDLAGSLNELKSRIIDAKGEFNNINGEISNNGNLLDQLSGKLGVSVKGLVGWGTAIGAGKLALDTLKDAFFQSESNIDEWGRTVKGAEGAYDVFLQTINNGNWSSFFSNLNDAINGARDLYDAFDRLGSIKSNNQAAIAIVQQQIQQLRLQKQQGQNVDAQLKAATERLAQLQKQAVDAGKTAGTKQMRTSLRNSVNTTLGRNNHINDKTLDYTIDKILKGGQNTMDAYARNYATLRAKGMTADRVEKYRSATGQVYERTIKGGFDINLLTKEQQRQYAIAKAVTERETEIQKGISTYAQAVQEGASNAKEQVKNVKYGSSGSGSNGKTTTAPKLVDNFNLQQVQGLSMGDLITAGRGQTIHELQAYLKDVMYQINNTDDPETKWKLQADAKDLKEQIAHMEKDPLSLDFDPAKMAKDAKDQEDKEAKEKKGKKKDPVELASQAVSGISAIGNGLKGIGIDLGSGFDQMIGVMSSVLTIIEGVNAIISVIEALSSGRDTAYQATMIGEVTTANTLLATIAATNWVPFHSGGMVHAATGIVVPGSPNGGHDTVPAILSPGEVVLNAAQQNNLANELHGSGLGNLHLETEFGVEKIRIRLNNNSRRRGKGEYVTSKS